MKKTKRGAVVKVVREHYLRDDVWCGVAGCGACRQSEPVLEAAPLSASELCPQSHLLLPDTNVALHQMDVLEDTAVTNVIVLQVVLQEVKHQNLSVYKRLRDAIGNPAKRFHVFANEHHKDTYVERLEGESANDRNDRAIRTAAKWYSNHLSHENKSAQSSSIVFLTDDRENRKKALALGLTSYTINRYVESLTDHPSLLDRVASSGSGPSNDPQRNVKTIFPEHLPLSVIQAGLKSGKYLQGVFQASRENYLEGFVNVHSMERWVLLQGLTSLNRAVHEDIVAIELLPEAEWSCPSGVVTKDSEEAASGEETEGDESDKIKPSVKQSSREVPGDLLRPTGRVVGVIRRNWRPYCGTLLPLPTSMEGRRHTFIPAERRIPRVRLETRQGSALVGKRIIVSIDSWPRSSRFPRGHFVRELGEIGDKATENEVLLIEHDVPHQSFSAAVLADLPQVPWGMSAEEEAKREDLCHLDICSVDPPGCTDIDDALHCRALKNGSREVGVHIADVSHFIRPGSSLDKEAANRGTTVYLSDTRIDMVPELLSSNLCSLRGGEKRYAFSCIWEVTPQADIVSTRFVKSIIRSRVALTYAEAQMRIDDKAQNDTVTTSLRHLNKLAKILKQRRIDSGALTLASPEIRFEIDSETHDPIDLQAKELRDTNSLVEEFMLLANISVARHLHETFPHCALLRRHPAPPLSNYDTLIKAAACKEVVMEVDSAKALASSLERAVLPGEPYFNTMLRIMTTRCMMQALYFCSGTLPEEEFRHYGLATPIYTHFTSPIRRFSDLVVHRLLAASIGADSTYPDLLDKHKMQQLSNHLNHRHKMAQYAAHASVQLHMQLFFKDKVCTEEGFVLFVHQNALQVLIPKYGLEGMVFFDGDARGSPKKHEGKASSGLERVKRSRPLDVVHDPSQSLLVVEGVRFRVFDRVTVQVCIERSSLQQSKLKLYLDSPEVPRLSTRPDETPAPTKKQRRTA